ncbi:MAG: hypothetical protein HW419_940 [Deltaproteobacteria bacterium]|nr:hypothetical protein [Deltaproteobacteria bacterium]
MTIAMNLLGLGNFSEIQITIGGAMNRAPYKIDILFAPFALSAVDSPGLNRAG